MMLRKIAGRIRIGTSIRFKGFSTNNKVTIEPKSDGSLTHHDSYRDLDKLDFMTAAKILFTTPPKQKKFGLDFHLVQLFFVCLPSLAVYLVAQYARHEMKKMDAELERRQMEEAKKMKLKEEEVLGTNPQLLEMENGDDWLAYDKLQHFLLCFSITVISSSLASRSRYSLLRRRSITVGGILSLFIGAAKEVADELGFFKSAGASAKDAVADIVGVIVAAVALSLYNFFCHRHRSVTLGQTRGVEMV
ncbi:hypothetical protein LXL04_009210 [Taraxacum kok-saghyz]